MEADDIHIARINWSQKSIVSLKFFSKFYNTTTTIIPVSIYFPVNSTLLPSDKVTDVYSVILASPVLSETRECNHRGRDSRSHSLKAKKIELHLVWVFYSLRAMQLTELSKIIQLTALVLCSIIFNKYFYIGSLHNNSNICPYLKKYFLNWL